MSEGIRHRESGQDRHAGALEPVHGWSCICVSLLQGLHRSPQATLVLLRWTTQPISIPIEEVMVAVEENSVEKIQSTYLIPILGLFPKFELDMEPMMNGAHSQ